MLASHVTISSFKTRKLARHNTVNSLTDSLSHVASFLTGILFPVQESRLWHRTLHCVLSLCLLRLLRSAMAPWSLLHGFWIPAMCSVECRSFWVCLMPSHSQKGRTSTAVDLLLYPASSASGVRHSFHVSRSGGYYSNSAQWFEFAFP